MPPRAVDSTASREAGTASVELIAVVPFVLLAVLVAAQLALAGQALWSAGVAARAASRAALVGGDPATAAREALPAAMRSALRVSGSGPVSLRVPVPRLLPALPRVSVSVKTSLGPSGG